MNSLAEAIKYIELGWSVIPIIQNSKRPTQSWKESQDKKISAIEAIPLFPDGTNIGLVCGDISGVLVIDDDSYKKKVGDEALKLDTPLFATTPRGGKHYYYRYKEGGNTVNQELAMDIRSKGGYVLLPPSVVEYEDGSSGTYTWAIPPSKELLEALPEAPESILRQLYGQTRVQTHLVSKESNLWANATNFDASSAMNVKEGGRNNALSRLTLSLINKFGEAAALPMAKGANESFIPPLDEKEVMTVYESAIKKYRESPPPPRTYTSKSEEVLNTTPVSSEGFRHTSLQEDIAGAKKIFVEGKARGPSTGFEKLDTIVGGYIGGQSYLIYADTSVGKSIFAINSLVSLASEKVKTLYFDLENPMELTIERLAFVSSNGLLNLDEWRDAQDEKDEAFFDEVLQRISGLSLDVWDLNKLTERFGDITWAGVKKCIEEAVDSGVRVVVVDHLHYFSPSETDHAILGEVMRQINNLCAQYNVSIVVVAHTKKGLTFTKDDKVKTIRPTIDHISGSGLIGKHCKNIISLQRNVGSDVEEERTSTRVYVDKTKFGPTDSFKLRFSEEQLCFFDDGETDREKATESAWKDLDKKEKPISNKKEEKEEKDEDSHPWVEELSAKGGW